MIQTDLIDAPKDPWKDLVNADSIVRSSMTEFLRLPRAARYDSILNGLRAGGPQRVTAVRVIQQLSIQEQQDLFPELLKFASSAHGLTQKFRDLILALPREWVLARIEESAESLLAASTEKYQFEEYRRLLELYSQLGDRSLVERLARRALTHPDEDVRDAGQQFLELASR